MDPTRDFKAREDIKGEILRLGRMVDQRNRKGKEPLQTREDHIQRHKELHNALDELLADWITHTEGRPSETTVLDFIKWSHQQTIDPVGRP